MLLALATTLFVTLAWDASVPPIPYAPIAEYKIYLSADPLTTFKSIELPLGTPMIDCEIDPLSPTGETCYARLLINHDLTVVFVTAVSTFGAESGASNILYLQGL